MNDDPVPDPSDRSLRSRTSPGSGLPTTLLSVAGRSPQVITETLYSLLIGSRPPADVRQIHVLTTRDGAEQVRAKLLDPRTGWFHRFCREYGIPRGRIRFNASCIHVPRGLDGRPLDDVRTQDDNLRMADTILEVVRELTRDPGTALHASVAGGRKTMGLFLGTAFQLFARPQDRLSHVLVSPDALEGCPDFYYPPRVSSQVSAKGRVLSTASARIELAEIPAVLLRDKVRPMGLGTLSYSQLIARAQDDLGLQEMPPELRLDPVRTSLRIGEQAVRLTPLEFAVYRLLAEHRQTGCEVHGCPGCTTCMPKAGDFLKGPWKERLLTLLADLGVRDERVRALSGWTKSGDERFLQVRSRIERKLRATLGLGRWVDRYVITSTGRWGETRYHIPLPPSLIRIT